MRIRLLVAAFFFVCLLSPHSAFAAECVPIAPPAVYRFDSFYKKFCLVQGIPLVSSAAVSDAALTEAARNMEGMLAGRADIARSLVERNVTVAIIAATEKTTDIPAYRSLPTLFPNTDWDGRTRGVGATIAIPVSSAAEENLLCAVSDRYRGESIFVHEFAHTLKDLGVEYIDTTFDARLARAYTDARKQGLWSNTYAGSNAEEYWAVGVQAYFDAAGSASPTNGIYNSINTRTELRRYDPVLYALIDEVFDTTWKWTCPKVARETASTATLELTTPNGGETYTAGSNMPLKVNWIGKKIPRNSKVCVSLVSRTASTTSFALATADNGCIRARTGRQSITGTLTRTSGYDLGAGSYYVRATLYGPDPKNGKDRPVLTEDMSDGIITLTDMTGGSTSPSGQGSDTGKSSSPRASSVLIEKVEATSVTVSYSYLPDNSYLGLWSVESKTATDVQDRYDLYGSVVSGSGTAVVKFVKETPSGLYRIMAPPPTGWSSALIHLVPKSEVFTIGKTHTGSSSDLPNLVAGSVSHSGTAPVGATVSLSSTVKNAGKGAVAGSFINTFGLDENADHGSIYGTINIAMKKVPAGSSAIAETSFAFPYAGTWYVRLCADNDSLYAGSVTETNETDNCGEWSAIKISSPRSENLQLEASASSPKISRELAQHLIALLEQARKLIGR